MSKEKKIWFGVAIGCGVILTIVGICVAAGAYFAVGAVSPVADAPTSFLHDLRTGNDARALQRMSHSYQQSHPLPTFQANVNSLPALRAQTGDASMLNVNVVNANASVSGQIQTASGPVPVAFTLTLQGEHWYIDTVVIEGVPLR